MCGISGFIARVGDGHAILDKQLGAIKHRGPDGEGRLVDGALHMGMRRLSIIDLEHGWQPLYSRSKRVAVFQNGEIYNHLDLRSKLIALGYGFKTHSDTEVLAHGYDAWGIEGLLDRIDGMYAIAVADLDTRILHLARDRFGEKPLYFSYRPGRFVYGSSLRSIVAAPWIEKKINPEALERYLACHFVPGRRTIIAEVERVLPGERLEIDLDSTSPPRLHRYYQPEFTAESPSSLEEMEELLSQAVKSRLVADVPVGLFLSGGIDSSLIAALASRSHRDIQAFSISFDDARVDESPHAKAVADYLGIRLKTFAFDGSRFVDLIPEVCAALDEPIGDQALLPLHWLAFEAARDVKVVLSGEGADELFGGYNYYSQHAQRVPMPFKDAYSASSDAFGRSLGLLVEQRGETLSGFPLLTFKHEREHLVHGASGLPDIYERELVGWLSTARDPLQRAGGADLASWLADDLLVKADRMTMAASIEGRAPFLAPAVVERALSLPTSQKYTARESKVILRGLARKILPASIVDRPKQGFVLPMRQWVNQWFDAHGGLSHYVRDIEELGIDRDALVNLHAKEDNQSRERLWFAVITLMEWWRSFRHA